MRDCSGILSVVLSVGVAVSGFFLSARYRGLSALGIVRDKSEAFLRFLEFQKLFVHKKNKEQIEQLQKQQAYTKRIANVVTYTTQYTSNY
jgi:hypothetical protein